MFISGFGVLSVYYEMKEESWTKKQGCWIYTETGRLPIVSLATQQTILNIRNTLQPKNSIINSQGDIIKAFIKISDTKPVSLLIL